MRHYLLVDINSLNWNQGRFGPTNATSDLIVLLSEQDNPSTAAEHAMVG